MALPNRWLVQLDANKPSFFTAEHCDQIGPDFRFCLVDKVPPWLTLDPAVIRIEPDQVFSTSYCQTSTPWHLSDLQTFVTGGKKDRFSTEDSMQGPVPLYIVDTWMDVKHPEFRGRAIVGVALAEGTHTHGTHVAGLASSATYGPQKGGLLVNVVVLDSSGTGAYSRLLQGLAWIAKKTKGIVNISISGPLSAVVNDAVNALVDQGYPVFVAAGNEDRNACEASPAAAKKAITVGATSRGHRKAGFSNWGPCVDIWGPGDQVLSTMPGGGLAYMSGTSMASPLVAGMASLWWKQRGFPAPSVLKAWLVSHAAVGRLTGLPQTSYNLFAQQPQTAPCPAGINTTVLEPSTFLLQVK